MEIHQNKIVIKWDPRIRKMVENHLFKPKPSYPSSRALGPANDSWREMGGTNF